MQKSFIEMQKLNNKYIFIEMKKSFIEMQKLDNK